MHTLLHQKWSAIFAFTVLWILLEAVWYSPKVFGKLYIKETSIKDMDVKATSLMCWMGAAFNAFLALFALSFFNRMTGSHTFVEGLLNGFVAWLGFVATSHSMPVIWENGSPKVFGIHAGLQFILMLLFGGLLAIW